MNSLIPEVSTKFNFIHLSNGSSESSAATGDFWFTIALPFLIIAIIAAAIYVYANRKRFSKIDFKTLGIIAVSSVLVTGFVQGASKAIAAEDFTGKQIDVIVNEAGGPVSYGEGENSNVQTIKNTTDDLIWFDQINLKDESGSSFVGHWTAKMDDDTTLFDGGAGDSYILANSVIINSGESITVTWTTDTDSSELLGNSGINETYIEYLLNDPNLTVSFESNGGSAVPSASVRYGETVAKPTDPDKDYYDFIYWTVDEDLQVEVNFNDPIYEDTTYFAKWDLAQTYKDQLCEEVTATATDLKSRINGCTHTTEAAKEQYAQEIDTKESAVKAEIQGLHTKEDADLAKQDADSWFLDEAKIAFKSDFTECRGSDATKIKALELLTNAYIAQVMGELSSTYDEGVSQIDSQTTIENANNKLSEYEGKCDAFYTAAVAFRDNKIAGKGRIDAAVDASNAIIDAAVASTYLIQDEATAYKATITAAAEAGKPAIDAVDFPEDLQAVIDNYLGTINNTAAEAKGLADLRENTIETSSAKANALLQTVIKSNWFNQTYISNLSNTLNTETTNFKNTAMGTQDLDEINAAYGALSSELDMMAANIQMLISSKENADKKVKISADQAYAAIISLKYYSNSQKQALQNKIDTDKNTAHTNLINTTDGDVIDEIAKNFSINVSALINDWYAFDQAKSDADEALTKEFEDQLNIIASYHEYLSNDDIDYFSENIITAKGNLFNNLLEIETSSALTDFVNEQRAMVADWASKAKARRDRKEHAQNDLIAAQKEHKDIVDAAGLKLESDTKFYKDEIDNVYNNFKGAIKEISPTSSESDIDNCLLAGIGEMTRNSDAARVIEDLRDEALNIIPTRQAAFNAAIETIVGLTTDDISSYKESFAAVQQDVITDKLNNMHFENEISEAEEVVTDEANALKADAQALPFARSESLININELEDNAVEWIGSLYFPSDPQKDEWTDRINEATSASADNINNECHTTEEVEAAYNDYYNWLTTTLKAPAQVETGQTASWVISSNIFPLYDSGELNEYDYLRLSNEIQKIVTDFNAVLEDITDPGDLMFQTTLTTFALSRYGESGNLRPVKITTQSAFIEFVYGEGEHQVTSSSFNIYGFGNDTFKVKVNIEDGHELDQIIDNNGTTYTLDEDGYFTFVIDFDLTTITVTEK